MISMKLLTSIVAFSLCAAGCAVQTDSGEDGSQVDVEEGHVATQGKAAPKCGQLAVDATLAAGSQITSCDGRFSLSMQLDGNLVLYEGGSPLWASNTAYVAPQPTNGSCAPSIVPGECQLIKLLAAGLASLVTVKGTSAVFQDDGNFVVYGNTYTCTSGSTSSCTVKSANAPLWASNTANKGGTSLPLQNDGNLVMYAASGTPIWASNTGGH